MKRLLGISKDVKIIAPRGTLEFEKEIKEKCSNTTSDVKILEDSLYDSVLRHDEINDIINKLKVEKYIIEHTIMESMLHHENAYIKERKITWKSSVRSNIDTKRLKAEEPDVYNRYMRQVNTRIFKIK